MHITAINESFTEVCTNNTQSAFVFQFLLIFSANQRIKLFYVFRITGEIRFLPKGTTPLAEVLLKLIRVPIGWGIRLVHRLMGVPGLDALCRNNR